MTHLAGCLATSLASSLQTCFRTYLYHNLARATDRIETRFTIRANTSCQAFSYMSCKGQDASGRIWSRHLKGLASHNTPLSLYIVEL